MGWSGARRFKRKLIIRDEGRRLTSIRSSRGTPVYEVSNAPKPSIDSVDQEGEEKKKEKNCELYLTGIGDRKKKKKKLRLRRGSE